MDYEPGDEYDCDACGGIHEVREGKSLRVASGEELPPAPYVRCPEAGVISLSGAETALSDDDGWP